MKILIGNVGSTSLKFKLIDSVEEISAVGFKTVLAKGFYGIHELDEKVLHAMEEYLFVAPAHNKPYLEAIGYFRELIPNARMIGIFETAFHITIPLERAMYAIPYEWYEKYGIKRMGYHGASHSYVSQTLTGEFGGTGRTISCHLGGSCSICAIKDGKSVDNSFGFSLQTGIPHANRSGDVDSYIVPFLLNEGLKLDDILNELSTNGGLLGISGVSSDLRRVEKAMEDGDERSKLAIDVFVNSIVRYIGAYYAELGGLDRIVFTGGIGENSHLIRRLICDQVKHMGIKLDEEANQRKNNGNHIISSGDSKVQVIVILANEEIGLARHTYKFITG